MVIFLFIKYREFLLGFIEGGRKDGRKEEGGRWVRIEVGRVGGREEGRKVEGRWEGKSFLGCISIYFL